MNSLWWLALPVLALPIWWHRQKREQTRAEVLATARFLPRAEPKQMRVWRWSEPLLLLLRCLLLATMVAWLADPVIPWRGDTVLVAAGTDKAWIERQVQEAKFAGASRIELPAAQLLAWLHAHEREWKPESKLLLVGDVPMPAARPQFAHRVELRTQAKPLEKIERHVAIVSERPAAWRALFASLDGQDRYVIDEAPGARTELVVWDVAQAPPPTLRSSLWWVGEATAFPELKQAKEVEGLRYADSARGRLWASGDWPPKDAEGARRLFEIWQRLHYAPVAYTAPATVLAVSDAKGETQASGALRETLMMALVALFALERILTHARRR